MSVKNTGKFALVQKKETGNGTTITARATDDIVIKRGQIIFFNDLNEELEVLVSKKIISADEAKDRKVRRTELDEEYGVETVYSLRAGNPPAPQSLSGPAPGSKL